MRWPLEPMLPLIKQSARDCSKPLLARTADPECPPPVRYQWQNGLDMLAKRLSLTTPDRTSAPGGSAHWAPRFRTFQACPKDLPVSSGATLACGKLAQRVPRGSPCPM